MSRRKGERRAFVKHAEQWRLTGARSEGSDRRIYGEADRRKEIHAELAELYKRRCDDCTPTCIHSQGVENDFREQESGVVG